ncbi:MAG: hypothetical protein ACJARD_000937 [Alphaproteobacteria bacterium]|jgi:hypothetical protein
MAERQVATQEEAQEDVVSVADMPIATELAPDDIDPENIDEETLDDAELAPETPEEVLEEIPEARKFLNRTIVFIMSGLHKGAGCAVEAETSIGSSFDNDLIITDDHIAEQHLVLRPIEKGLDYAIEVICKGENIIINGETLISTEQTVIMQDTFVVTLGTISINVTLHKAAKSTLAYKKYMAPRLKTLESFGNTTKELLSPTNILSDLRNIILLLIVIIAIIGSLAYYFTRPVEKEDLRSSYADFKDIKSLTIKEASNSLKLNRQAKSDLEYVLKKYNLLNRLDVSSKKNVIYVKGRINQYEMKSWRKAQNWFDTTYGSGVNLVTLIDLNNGLRRTISFKAVVADGSMPYVVSWTGDRFRPGATLPGGWIVLKIADDGVTVKDAVDNRIFLVKHIRSQHGMKLPNFRQ